MFVAALERVVHEHGPLTQASLLEHVAREALDPDAVAPLLQRILAFHEVADDDIAAALGAVLHRLRQRAVDEELQWLIESGELSEAATTRRNELISLRAELKTLR